MHPAHNSRSFGGVRVSDEAGCILSRFVERLLVADFRRRVKTVGAALRRLRMQTQSQDTQTQRGQRADEQLTGQGARIHPHPACQQADQGATSILNRAHEGCGDTHLGTDVLHGQRDQIAENEAVAAHAAGQRSHEGPDARVRIREQA